jgi:hypothetical protein
VEVFVDVSRDRYANGPGWGRQLCRDLADEAGYLEYLDCRAVALGGR